MILKEAHPAFDWPLKQDFCLTAIEEGSCPLYNPESMQILSGLAPTMSLKQCPADMTVEIQTLALQPEGSQPCIMLLSTLTHPGPITHRAEQQQHLSVLSSLSPIQFEFKKYGQNVGAWGAVPQGVS